MARDDLSDAWAKKLEESKGAAPDANAEALRRAMEINPALAASLRGAPAAGSDKKRTVKEALSLEKSKFQSERKLLKDEIAKLQAQEKALVGKTLDKILDAICDADPDLKDKASEDALKSETLFLSEIGFQKAKIQPHKLKRK